MATGGYPELMEGKGGPELRGFFPTTPAIRRARESLRPSAPALLAEQWLQPGGGSHKELPRLPGDESAYTGVEESGPPPPDPGCSQAPIEPSPLRLVSLAPHHHGNPGALGQLSGPGRAPTAPGPRLFRLFLAAPHHRGNSG